MASMLPQHTDRAPGSFPVPLVLMSMRHPSLLRRPLLVQENEECSISVLLLPAGGQVAPYSRPGASVVGFVPLKGAVGVRSFACSEARTGALLAQGLPESGLHDPRSREAKTNKKPRMQLRQSVQALQGTQ